MRSVSRRHFLAFAAAAGLSTWTGAGAAPLPRTARPESSPLPAGAGSFLVDAGPARPRVQRVVHYYRPRTLTPDSPILIVLAGAGRNADAYRDAWIAEAERANVLVAAPTYRSDEYDIAAYQMGGIVKDFSVRNMPPDGDSAAHLHLRDEDIQFTVNPDRGQWIFQDFEHLFDALVAGTGSHRSGYDLFGHSAGAQIVHRHALFCPQSRADRIVAANAGIYTLPDLQRPPLIGMAGTGVSPAQLRAALAQRLIVLAGEDDIGPNNGGSLLHTPLLDATGIDRLARARYFYEAAQQLAARWGAELGWRLEIVPNTGHDFRAMSRAAGQLLYPRSA